MNKSLVFIAANRFGYGANQQTLAQIVNQPVSCLLTQISADNTAKISQAYRTVWNSTEAHKHVKQYRQLNRQLKNMPKGSDKKSKVKDKYKKQILAKVNAHILYPISQATFSESPFFWRLLDFFSNHFSVSKGNLEMRALASTLESEAIAPHLSGSFKDMLEAVETHPAMLLYLNNAKSVGPNSRYGKKRPNKGLNENLGREILELHTLGVQGGYVQDDVRELAKTITGWSVKTYKDEESGFIFRQNTHEPGQRTILGKRYPQPGIEKGIQVLRDLADHPETAKHVCTKLVAYFIADNPPTKIIDSMVVTWLETQGNLPKVLATMLAHPLSWQHEQQKFKTPRDLLISTCRACGVDKIQPKFVRSLSIMGQAPFSAGSPAGYKVEKSAWSGPYAMMTRIEWSGYVGRFSKYSPTEVAKNSLGPLLNENTLRHVERAESKRQAMALLIMSPEFQTR